VRLLNKRAISATKIGHIKREYDVPVYVPSREEDVISHVQEVNQGPLGNNAIRRLFERIIDESRRLERESSHTD
jgi:chorismate mutase